MPKTNRSPTRLQFAHGAKRLFILSQPHSMPAKEVQKAALQKGLKIAEGYVYMVRAKGASKTLKSALQRVSKPERLPSKRRPPSGARERAFVEAALELGTIRAGELLEQLRQESAS
jgi:hypothetical protein